MKSKLICILALAVIAVGCAKEKCAGGKTAGTTEPEVKTYASLASNDVVISVNGVKLTKAEVERAVDLGMAIMAKKSNKTNRAMLAQEANRMRKQYPSQFVTREILKSEAQARGLTVGEADITESHHEFSKGLPVMMSYKALKNSLTETQKETLEAEIVAAAWIRKGRAALEEENLKPVTDAEISSKRHELEEYNKIAAATNALVWKAASNVWNRITAGEPFENVARRYEDAENVEVNLNWGPIKASDFEDDPEFHKWIGHLPLNCLTPPFAGNNGVMIVKLIAIETPKGKNDASEPTYRYHRVFFALPEFWEPESDDAIRSHLEEAHRGKAFQTAMTSCFKKATIEYPNGEHLFAEKRNLRSQLPQGLPLPRKLKGLD